MHKGKLSSIQKFEHVPAIRDIDLFGDGVLHTIWILSEGLIDEDNQLQIASDAKVIEVRAQNPSLGEREIAIPDSIIERSKKLLRK